MRTSSAILLVGASLAAGLATPSEIELPAVAPVFSKPNWKTLESRATDFPALRALQQNAAGIAQHASHQKRSESSPPSFDSSDDASSASD
jgi:hypothetical protein